ncbi:MAG TPA: hypothetical protein PLJ29_07885, partial [Leptospiraceae bacterium]|nr:hypothetical protein [Leptospiraceae bacterium]
DRLMDCPKEFYSSDRSYRSETENKALFSDLHFFLTGKYPDEKMLALIPSDKDENLGRCASMCTYILFHQWFRNRKEAAELSAMFLSSVLPAYSSAVSADEFAGNSERREELIRLLLYHLGYFPKGETEKYSLNRLAALDSVERDKVIKESREVMKKVQALREAMARKAAEEAASKMTGE